MRAAEPTLATLSNPVRRYFFATRPAFLTITLLAALLRLATAFGSGIILNAATAGVTVLFALMAHAGVNVLNDYYDALNGTDDRKADEAAGKRHWVVRLGSERARWVYVVIAATAYLWMIAAAIARALPWLALVSLLPAAMSARAARDILKFATEPQRLVPAIQMTIAAASVHGLLLALALACAHLLT